MKVEFETNYRDFAEAVWLASGAKLSSGNLLFNFLCFYAVIAALASLPLALFAPHFIFAVLEFVIIFVICFYLFRPPTFEYFAKEFLSVYGSKPFNYEVELNEDSVKVSDDLSASKISWERVKEINEADENIFLIFKHKNGLKIPKTAFAGSAQIGEFIAFATSRIPISTDLLNDRNNQ